MKRIIFFGIFLLCNINHLIYSQYGWYNQNSKTLKNLRVVQFVDSNNGFAYGDVMLKTSNGGINWIKTSDTLINTAVRSISFINSLTGFIISGTPASVKKTTDGGYTWTVLYTNAFDYINFINENTGYFFTGSVPYPFVLRKTTNSGLNWEVALQFPIYPVSFVSIGDSMCIGANNAMYCSSNGGISWYTRNFPSAFWHSIFKTKSYNNIFIMNYSCPPTKLYRTTNNGINWVQLPIQQSCTSQVGYYVNNSSIYLLASNSIYFSSDNGNSWILQKAENSTINDIFMIDSNTGYVVGSNGLIFKTNYGGNPNSIGIISTDVPDKFKLFSNYPNPFNPVTNIKFDIPQRSNVKILIYDILGKEISVLVSEELNPGSFEVNWDASNFPSGVYFYKVVTDNYSESKKMVLVK